MNRKILLPLFICCTLEACSNLQPAEQPTTLTMKKTELLDKIKGGWAGQTIGCTYGGPTEFKWRGTIIQDYFPIRWDDGNIKRQYETGAGLYDDIYMDLTFVEVIERLGIDAPVDSFALAFAEADYVLWHANQAARYNILNGIMPPESGHWLNNPHADDLDYQIESDFAGLMSPGMPNVASDISDRIGHIMNYGDGWYGGIYVGALYSLAFVYNDIETIVSKAIKAVPVGSKFRACIDDVIRWYKAYPTDWKQTWFECQKKWSEDIGCPEGALAPYDIDALINSAYITIGLLYGQGDFFKTMDISTRCGQDSDCNPSSACGILGTMIGYNRIPKKWLTNLQEAEDMKLAYTSTSLNEAYQLSFKHALQMISRQGGEMNEDAVTIRLQEPKPVRLEQGFEKMIPVRRLFVDKHADPMVEFSFVGTAFALTGSINNITDQSYCAELNVNIDGQDFKVMKLPKEFKRRSQELCWAYQLDNREHHVILTWINPVKDGDLHCNIATIYSNPTAL
ncbi:MAG: ADP-ribosylglycohydrolase family protein [Bacteroidales bacterium]|nr:ADP-ribosylglycohydrolase family protein [Bacteroidales bacterium]